MIGAGDLRFLAWAMAAASSVLAVGALTVAGAGAGIGWLWAALHAWMLVRLATLLARFASPPLANHRHRPLNPRAGTETQSTTIKVNTRELT